MLKGKSFGACVSKERCAEILTEEIQDLLPPEKWEDYERSVNRVLYEFKKLDGAKPKYNKGKHVKAGIRAEIAEVQCRSITISARTVVTS